MEAGSITEHAMLLFIALMRCNPEISWRANNHDNGTMYENWFVAGMHLPTGDISYHLKADMWELLDRSGIQTSLKAPEWDGHTANDTLERLGQWINRQAGT